MKIMKPGKYIFVIVFLIISVLIMISGNTLKNLFKGDEIPELLNGIKYDLKENEWKSAENKTIEIKEIFNKVTKIIRFSVERDEIYLIKFHLSLLNGYIISHDYSNSLAEVYLLNEYWKEIR
jgi:ABC-type Na+ efflux pump permease subunit